MTETRIKFNTILQNQLPSYVKEEFPLVAEFLKQYYISQEFEGAAADLIQNIDQYIKLDTIKQSAKSSFVGQDISIISTTIVTNSFTGTLGFPDSYGLLLIDDEIITYTGKTSNSFTGCIRGFSGVTSYKTKNSPDELEFKTSNSSTHSAGTEIVNLSSLFLNEFLNKVKYQLVPGFENREFYSGLDKYLFLKQSKDFYSTRGTDTSFKILFKVLYGENVEIIKPRDFLIRPSDAQYNITNDLVVESISGNPYELENSTLIQDQYQNYNLAKASIAKVEKIFDSSGKNYYKLGFDAGYNKDINVSGSLYGNFYIHTKTKLIGSISAGAQTLDVDSTVGFPNSGELSVTYSDGTNGVISYSSKNLNQFLECENVIGNLLDNSDIWINTYAYGESNKGTGEIIKVRISPVLKNIDIVDTTKYQKRGTNSIIRTLGIGTKDDYISNNWVFNVSANIEVSSLSLEDETDDVYRISTKDTHDLKIGDNITITSSDGVKRFSTVIRVISDFIFNIRGQGNLNLNNFYTIQRNLLKVNSQNYPELSNQLCNVQNVYKIKDKILVSSPSLPFYNNQPLTVSDRSVVFSGTFFGDTFSITSNKDHGFYTGDSVYYTSETGSLFNEGIYFIKRIDSNKVKFAKSRSNIYNSIFVTLDYPATVVNSKIQNSTFKGKALQSQKLLREISPPVNDGNTYSTNQGSTGILINGVEILNYKSTDKIYYGSIENINVLNSGIGYDIINPPKLVISDSVGYGATGHCSVKGSLRQIRIIDPGFDYLETPKIKISGGNGKDAKAYASMKLVDHKVSFNSEEKTSLVDITNNIIGFSTYHKFKNAEKVIYKTENQQSVGGISTNSVYYVFVKDLYNVKLHKTFNDALSGINTINLTSYGVGNHIFESYSKKSVIASVNIENFGYDYENKKRTIYSSGISTSLGYINIKNHDFNSGEIVQYSTEGSAIGGLTNNEKYYITKVDNDNFKLSHIGIGSDNQDFYYTTNQYIELTSKGSGLHIFNYPEISVEIIGNVGISSTSDSLFKGVLQPIFRGQITSIHLQDNGVGYGSSEIINFDRSPLVTLSSGSDAKLVPIINNGSIVEVFVNSSGFGYNSPPDLNILTNGNGSGAVLTPVIENGQIKSVKIIEGGSGYDPNNTFIDVSAAGAGCQLKSELKTWTINLFAKYFNKISKDDGFIFENSNSKYELQYAHIYAPRKLRESLNPKGFNGKSLYGKSDLIRDNNFEISSTDHSPIIGWAYDGNPIYGPYGYSGRDGGLVSRMKSGYKVSLKPNRPPQNQYPVGFFVEDYEYNSVDDDLVLDEHNGRFCITPDFPKGTYAYFATIDDSPSQNFDGYRLPVFPYFIGNSFKSSPNPFNFSRFSNQDDIDLNSTNWARNTTPYKLLNKNSSYSYLNLPNLLNQTALVKYSSPGSIDNVGIITGGSNYKVNDSAIFENIETGGFGFSSKVSRIGGKSVNSISVASTSLYNAEIYSKDGNKNVFILEFNTPHNFANKDLIYVKANTSVSSLIDGFYSIGVSRNTFSISNYSGISSVSITGIVTYFSISGNLEYSDIKENDIFTIDSEKVKILNVDKEFSRIRVLRCIDNTVGTSHSYTSILYENPRRFTINDKNIPLFNYKKNKQIYFDPKESLGIGNSFGVGIGITLSLSNPGVGISEIFIPTKTIYLPKHSLETGDELIYSVNVGYGISVSKNGTSSYTLSDQSIVYVAKISDDLIGISTVKVGLNTTGSFSGITSATKNIQTLYFTGIGTGTYHSFSTNYNKPSSKTSKNLVTVSTAQTHGLLNDDYVYVNVNTGLTTTFIVKYNDYNRRLIINPVSFYSSDVNVTDNSITISNHKFEPGQKVIYTSSSPSGGLVNNKIYYIVVLDDNTIKLSETYFNSIKLVSEVVNITSASNGTLSLVNPPIKLYKNCLVQFDLSDSSLSYINQSLKYSAFKFNLYLDENYTQVFDKTKNSDSFAVKKYGRVGIDSDAKVVLNVDSTTPEKLFYKLDLIDSDALPTTKKEICIDSSIFSNNQIQIKYSEYNGEHKIVSTSSTSFTYTIKNYPETVSYSSNLSELSYETSSLNCLGPITKININSKGQNYYRLPYFSSVSSEFGSGAILEASSNSIGVIKSNQINDIGFDFPSDFTVRPNLSLPQILKIEPLNSFEFIGITSVGRGYNSPSKLVVLDGKTKNVLPEVNLRYYLGDTNVTILNNTYRLNKVTPIIIPTENSNGVGISSIKYDSSTKDVYVTLSVGFSTENSFPFSINDKILIENISIGVGSTGKGFNSENYNYNLFTVTQVDENIGGIGTITYNLSNYLGDNEYPGLYDPENSSGRVIPEKYFPKFNIVLKPNSFVVGEKVKYANTFDEIGKVEDWDENTNYLSVSSREYLKGDSIIEGISSKTQGKILSTIYSDSFVNLGAYSKSQGIWVSETGFLNDNLQRVQDNFYYQNFSYSLKSRVSYETWENAVGSLNHTSGFKKFSDYQLESIDNCGIKTDTYNIVDVTADITGIGDLNCVYDFDIAKENSLNIGSKIISDQITVSNRILTDYFESVGNRVLQIDDFSSLFNSNPRQTRFSVVDRFLLQDARAQKYITFVKDRRYINQRQLLLFTLIHDNSNGYLNQYGRLETSYDLGSFDFGIEGSEGVIYFYPTKYKVNDYDIVTLSCNLKDSIAGIGSTVIGNIVKLDTDTKVVSSGSTTIVGLGSTYRSAKILVEISGNSGQYQFEELNVIHDGTNIEFINYGQLGNNSLNAYSSSGLGTYNPYFSGSNLNIDFIPNTGIAVTINTVQVSISNTSFTGIGTFDIKHARFEAKTTDISSSVSPTPTVIANYPIEYDGGYFIVQVSDITNNRHQLSEVVVVNDQNDVYFTEYANLETHSSLGIIEASTTTNYIQLTFTPVANIELQTKVYSNCIRKTDDDKSITQYINGLFDTDYNNYFGTERDIKRSFELNHKNYPIFKRSFNGTDSSIVNISNNTIKIPNHFFVSGEKIVYSSGSETETNLPIGISTVNFGVGIGTTDRLPSSVYIIKVDQNTVKLAKSAQDALNKVPVELNLTSVGVGTNHSFTSTNQNAKALVTIDNVIQSPIVSTASSTTLVDRIFESDDVLYVNNPIEFFGGELILVDDEIMKITSIGIGTTNSISVLRPWLGTNAVGHSTGSKVTKVVGNYNIVENTINFADAPYGNVPLTVPDSSVQEDWIGISTSSSFNGRIFLRSGVTGSSNESYYKNYIFDDISSGFDGITNRFTLTSQGINISDIDTENGIILINDIFQGPGISNDYTLIENVGVTSVSFTGTATSTASDINTSNLPSGGIIVSVGSTEGFGYQPLVSAGGTAIVSVAGTISAISIGNSGSGYRSGIHSGGYIKPVIVRVGVALSSTSTPSIQFIGTASVSNGNIVSVAITNPGAGYTSTNPPYVIFDDPLSYSDIPLIYSSSSSGIGTQATIDIVVGYGSSVIDFEIKNTGYGYSVDEILTIPTGGIAGIPTTSNSLIKEFQINIQQTFKDKFTGWTIGELQVFDSVENLFNGSRVIFPLLYLGQLVSIQSSKGSSIDVQDTILVFLNDILQVPGEGYIFEGGSTIQFTEAPKQEDRCKILFYKGTGDVDVIFRNILETVKVGDELTLTYDPSRNQSPTLLEDPRTVMEIKSTNLVDTNPYFGPGNTSNPTLTRPLVWCKQTEDKIINERKISKDRTLYEPLIYPTTNVIQSIGIGQTIVYVESVRPFFNPLNENNISLDFQKNINIISQNSKVSASATALVSTAGTISSIEVLSGGFGYINPPSISIQNPIGVGTTTSTAVSSITSGIVTSISVIGVVTGYSNTNPPVVLVENPTLEYEENEVISYSGDFGIISGISTISVGVASTGLVFDFVIPKNSYLRDGFITGITTVSGIQTGYYFVITDSNIGNGVTSLNASGQIIGIGRSFLDGVYNVASVSIAQTSVAGFGITYVAKVVVSISGYNGLTGIGYSSYFGNYSWGRVVLGPRLKENLYDAYTLNGYVGIKTGTILSRTNPLKYLNYIS